GRLLASAAHSPPTHSRARRNQTEVANRPPGALPAATGLDVPALRTLVVSVLRLHRRLTRRTRRPPRLPNGGTEAGTRRQGDVAASLTRIDSPIGHELDRSPPHRPDPRSRRVDPLEPDLPRDRPVLE